MVGPTQADFGLQESPHKIFPELKSKPQTEEHLQVETDL